MIYNGAKNLMIKSILRRVLPGVLLASAGLLTAADMDINQMIQTAIKNHQNKLILPAGTCRVDRTIDLVGLTDFTLEGAHRRNDIDLFAKPAVL